MGHRWIRNTIYGATFEATGPRERSRFRAILIATDLIDSDPRGRTSARGATDVRPIRSVRVDHARCVALSSAWKESGRNWNPVFLYGGGAASGSCALEFDST